ncbi:NADPH-dependent cytochrome P450 oxidoreductase [Fennellomyces sp. T-0311]|nr:NADPH-dependent cytochrome P450 oxidoreductase [Fennellomyces sp. T-0311]
MTKPTTLNKQVILLVSALGLGAVAYMASQYFFGNNGTRTPEPSKKAVQQEEKEDESNFVQIMKKQNRKVVIFYGSQTGTAEDYAERLGKQCKKRFGVPALVLDLEQCNMKYLDQIPEDCIAMFVLATYGEGEPTDNATEFWELLESPEFSEGDDLGNLRYFIFGLGNTSYTYYNWVSKTVDKKLTECGATRLGELGLGDDEKSLEDDFEAWQEEMWPLFGESMETDAASNGSSGHDTTYHVVEQTECNGHVYCGELGDMSQNAWGSKKPYPALITTRDLLNGSDRHCLHLEVDISGSGMSYTTGDHIAIWPTNSEDEVLGLARTFGLEGKLDTIICVTATDETSAKKSPFPQPTTYRAMLRHYLDICQLPPRPTLEMIAPFAPSPEATEILQKLAKDKDEYRQVVLDSVRNLAAVLNYASSGAAYRVPSDVLVECFGRLQPRYYSISSSSSESPDSVSVTAVTLKFNPDPTPERTVFGVNTNYLWAVHTALNDEDEAIQVETEYSIDGPNGQYFDDKLKTAKLPVHIRQSSFKLPTDTTKPVIMVGPGTGVAPFRGFVRERAYQKKHHGKSIGPTILYFGCRRSNEDFLYKEEWPELFNELGGSSRLITAFSRETDRKVYVQDKLNENATETWDLIANKGAYVYVCGDAKRMAKDVQSALVGFAKQFGGYDDAGAADYISKLRDAGRYQEDVWA